MIANPTTPTSAKTLGIKRPIDKLIAEGRSLRSRLDSTLPNLKKTAPAVAVATELVRKESIGGHSSDTHVAKAISRVQSVAPHNQVASRSRLGLLALLLHIAVNAITSVNIKSTPGTLNVRYDLYKKFAISKNGILARANKETLAVSVIESPMRNRKSPLHNSPCQIPVEGDRKFPLCLSQLISSGSG